MVKPIQLLFDFLHGPALTEATHIQLGKDLNPSPVVAAVTPPRNGPIAYEVKHSMRRRSLALEVYRDARVVVRAPSACPDDVVSRYIRRHQRWIARQLAHFETLPQPRPAPQYRAGEAHLYLGREYRLVLCPDRSSKIAIAGDDLKVSGLAAADPSSTESALARWYHTHARVEFAKILATCHAHTRFAPHPLPALKVRTMRTRWGTMCTQRGMTLNTVLIQSPRECIEYVVFHELCHLSYRGHGPRFYRLLSSVLPDWEARKRRLESTITW